MLSILTESIFQRLLRHLHAKVLRHHLRSVVRAHLGLRDRPRLCRRRGTKSVILGTIILATARLFVAFSIVHPLWMLVFLILTSVTFSFFGFIIGVWADGWEKLQTCHADRDAAHFSRRQLLFHQHAAARVAEDRPVQPCRLPHQRLPLELLRDLDVKVVISFGMTLFFSRCAWPWSVGFSYRI